MDKPVLFRWKVFKFLVLIALIFELSPSRAWAFEVPDIPGDNLITNPWFRKFGNPNDSSLDGWTDAAGKDKYWSSSQKESNPSPDIVVSGVCGGKQVYCGTAARLSPTPGQSGGLGVPGVDAYLYQVVSANPGHRKLKFFTHWVSHKIDPAEVVIYGGNSPNGPWTQVWVPFFYVQSSVDRPTEGGQRELWTQTEFLETTIETGYANYKIEIHAKLPDTNTTGFKITGVYFATELGNEPSTGLPANSPTVAVQIETNPSSTPERVRTQAVAASPVPTVITLETSTAEAVATEPESGRITETIVPTISVADTATPSGGALITETPEQANANQNEAGDNQGTNPWVLFLGGVFAGALIVVVILLIRNNLMR